MRHTRLEESIAPFSQCAARWRVEAVLDSPSKSGPLWRRCILKQGTVFRTGFYLLTSGTSSASSWLGRISQKTYKQFSKGNTTQWIFIVHLMHTKELPWRPEEKQCSVEKEKMPVCRLWKKGMLDITQSENS